MIDNVGQFEQLVLAAILQGHPTAYGLSIRQNLSDRTGQNYTVGAVYATLQRLEEKGLIRSKEAAVGRAGGGRTRVCFTLTADGRRALETSLEAIRAMIAGTELARTLS